MSKPNVHLVWPGGINYTVCIAVVPLHVATTLPPWPGKWLMRVVHGLPDSDSIWTQH